jgi:hypothetical protein
VSGGHFEYSQYRIDDIAREIDNLIIGNRTPDEYGSVRDYPDSVIEKFKEGAAILRKAAIYAQRIDWLVSGDDGEDNFLKRLSEDLAKTTQSDNQS